MKRALQLASQGRGKVSSNPMVGCVIVKEGKILGEGFHQVFGGPHAEVAAIASIMQPNSAENATAYVTLEPCSHFGKTPPCADLLIQHKIERVIVAARDPNPKVAGKGLQRLRDHGIQVIEGVCAQEERDLNCRFHTFHESGRPYVILKWAQTADGYIARSSYDSKWISNSLSRQLVHQWRAQEDAILVGFNTVRYDNPELTVRDWTGEHPIRLILDPNDHIAELGEPNILDGKAQTLVFNGKRSSVGQGVEWIKCASSEIDFILKICYERNIQSILVEGGSATLSEFIGSNLWNEARVFQSRTQFGEGIMAPKMNQKSYKTAEVQNDKLVYYLND